MKKLAIALLSAMLLSALIVTGCGGLEPIKADGKTTILKNPAGDPTKYTGKENAYIVAGKLQEYDTYRTDVTGRVEANKLGISYLQEIRDYHIKNFDETFSESLSTSSIVNVGLQVFTKGEKAVLRSASDVKQGVWKDELNVTTTADYVDKYGVIPLMLSNYILNDDTITDSNLVSAENGLYKYHYVINRERGTLRYQKKMQRFGNLSGYPEFVSCDLYLTFKSDWTPVSVETRDRYRADMGIISNVDCVSTMTETFSEINEKQTIPEAERFAEALGETPTQLDPSEIKKPDPGLSAVVDGLLALDLGKGVTLRGSVGASLYGTQISLPLDASLSFDLEKLGSEGIASSFAAVVKTSILGLEAEICYREGTVYVRLGDSKYRYAVAASGDAPLSLEGLLEACDIRDNGEGNYTVQVDGAILDAINQALAGAFGNLSGGLGMLGGTFRMDALDIGVSVRSGRIASADLLAKFGSLAELRAEVTVADSEVLFPDDLDTFPEGDLSNLSGTLSAFLHLADKLTAFDWKTGLNLSVQLGLKTDTFFMPVTDIPVQLRLDMGEIAKGNFEAALRFNMELNLLETFKLDIYYHGDGNLYLKQYAQDGTESLTTIDVGDALVDLLFDTLLGGGLDLGSDTGILDTLAKTFAGMRGEVTDKEIVITFGETAREAIIGALNGVAAGLEMDFSSLDTICIVGVLKDDGSLNNIDLGMWETGENGSYSGIAVSLVMGEPLTQAQIDAADRKLAKLLADEAAAKPVREAIAYYTGDGMWPDASYPVFLDHLIAEYNALTDDQKKFVPNMQAASDRIAQYDSARSLVGTLDNLTFDQFADIDAYRNAIDEAQAVYDGLPAGLRPLVTNAEKLKAAQDDYTARLLAKLNGEMPGLAAELAAANGETPIEDVKALNESADKFFAYYRSLSAEEQKEVTAYEDFEKAYDKFTAMLRQRLTEKVQAIAASAEEIEAGEPWFTRIAAAKAVRNAMSPSQVENLPASATLDQYARKHIELETASVDAEIAKIGTVDETDASGERIAAARTAFRSLRAEYRGSVSKLWDLAIAEVIYVNSLFEQVKDPVTLADETAIEKTRAAYDIAMGYSNADIAQTIQDKLSLTKTSLEKAEADLAALKVAQAA